MKESAKYTYDGLLTESPVCSQRGATLLITLLLVSILTGLAVDFAYEVYIGTSALSNWSNAQNASFAAKSGQALASNLLKETKELQYTYPGELLLPVEKSFGDNTILTVKLEDEEAKFNVNGIIYPDGRLDNDAFLSLKKLFEYLTINPDVALYIADWIDPDNTPRAGGSEDNAKNAALWSVDELKFIKVIDKETFDKISPFLTVYGTGKININTAKLPVLVSLRDMTEPLAKQIIYYRESVPFTDRKDIINLSGLESVGITIQNKIIVKSSNFRVVVTATVDEVTRIIESVMDTSMNIHLWREA